MADYHIGQEKCLGDSTVEDQLRLLVNLSVEPCSEFGSEQSCWEILVLWNPGGEMDLRDGIGVEAVIPKIPADTTLKHLIVVYP